MSCFVYVIGLKKDILKNDYTKCYIGVSSRPKSRWKEHLKSKRTVGTFIRDNNLTYKENMKIIFEGEESACFKKEIEFRPFPYMGLNEAAGGNGGYTTYTQDRNFKISNTLKGREVTWIHKIIENRGSYKGNKNPNRKKWLIINPKGDIYNIEGNLQEFCDEHMLLMSCLKYYIGKKVPPINNNGYGGYRAKNERSRILRENTVFWKLICEE